MISIQYSFFERPFRFWKFSRRTAVFWTQSTFFDSFPLSTGKDSLMGDKFIPFQRGRLSNPERERERGKHGQSMTQNESIRTEGSILQAFRDRNVLWLFLSQNTYYIYQILQIHFDPSRSSDCALKHLILYALIISLQLKQNIFLSLTHWHWKTLDNWSNFSMTRKIININLVILSFY